MLRRSAGVLGLVVALFHDSAAQSAHPDFSGAWRQDTSRSTAAGGGRGNREAAGGGRGGGLGLGPSADELAIAQTATTLTIVERRANTSAQIVYALDGGQRTNAVAVGRNAGTLATYVSTWKGDRLETYIAIPDTANADTLEYIEKRYIEKDGSFVVETSRPGQDNMRRVVYLKAASRQASSVSIERVGDKRWRSTYHLDHPLTSLRFDRPAGFFRERVFTVATPGYHLKRDGDWQIVSLDSGATPKSDLVLDFSEFTDALTKEYELFQPFTDGAVALYTGHFPALATGSAPGDTTHVRVVLIQPPAGARAIVRGRVQQGAVTFADSTGDGTYVYLGGATPIETPDVVAVVDPGMPEWLKNSFNKNLPALFHEYATRLGAKLPWKPVVLFSFDERGTGRSSGGGSLTGFINMTLTGADWKTETPAAAEQAFQLIAHESAHLWNGQLVRNKSDGSGSWMHEGSADAMGTEMLRMFGVIDSVRYRARRAEALNRCVAGVATGPIETALRRGQTRTVYDCGFVMTTWAEGAARKSRPDASMFTFWSTLIANGLSAHSYDEATYYSTLTSLGVPNAIVERMRAFVRSTDSASILITGLQSVGIAVRAGAGDPPLPFQADLARAAMIHVMQQACNRVSFSSGSSYKVGAIPTCAPFSKEMDVFQIAGFRVRDQGAALYDAVRAACAANRAIALQGNDGTNLTSVPCTKALAPHAPWYELGT